MVQNNTFTIITNEERDDYVDKLRGHGCILEWKEDNTGKKRFGWWQDGVYLGAMNDPKYCYNVLMGNE